MSQTIHSPASPDPEVLEKPRRRVFSNAYKLRILQETEQAAEFGQVGAILRREGLYYSHLKNWRRQKENGELVAKKDARKIVKNHDKIIHQLQDENRKLRKELKHAQAVIDVQKKFSNLLEISLSSNETNDSSKS